MRRLLFVLLTVLVGSLAVYGQTMIDNFDADRPDTTHWIAIENSSSALSLVFDAIDRVEGTGSIKVNSSLGSLHQWGTYSQFGVSVPDTVTPWDWSISDSLSLWIKVRRAPTHPEYMVFRIQVADRPSPSDPQEQYIYENASIIDATTSGWINLRIPLHERTQPGTDVPDSTGFILAPTSWGGFTYNNRVLDRDKISEWNIGIITSGWDPANNLPADSVEVSFDKFERVGLRSVPAVIFNGRAFTGQVTATWSWGQSTVVVEPGAGPVPLSNAVKWTQGDEWGGGWTGWGGDINPSFNLAGSWLRDSLKLTIKSDTGVGPLRAQFESGGDGKRGIVFAPIADGQWHDYQLAMKDFVNQDGTTAFDSSNVRTFGLMAEASGHAGKVLYITNIWTGSPSIDVIPPPPPTGLAVAGASYVNLVTWNEVPNEPGIRYNVFYKESPWTDVSDPTVEDVPLYNLPSTLTNHPLRAPVTDQNVTYYYGVTAKDNAGNESTPVVQATPVTTLAQGVPTISKTGPVNFNANGSVTEWSTITPITLSVVSGTAHSVPNFPVNDDADLFVKAYIATDAQYLYVAFDVNDDVVSVDTAATDYLQDCPDLFIGLYDWRTKHHQGYRGGATPDYHIRFSKHRVRLDQDGGATVVLPGVDYIWKDKTLTPGYVVEARIAWTAIAAALPARNDAVFVPREGQRIPIDFSINDRDAGAEREGIMCYSPLNNDDSWRDMFNWTHTWIGSQWTVGVKQTSDVPQSYQLSQNYPNPFNPSTKINYSIAKGGMVSLKVYDLLGREIATLVNDNQEAGSYTVTVDMTSVGKNLASGVYFYRLEAGAFTAVNKMMMLK